MTLGKSLNFSVSVSLLMNDTKPYILTPQALSFLLLRLEEGVDGSDEEWAKVGYGLERGEESPEAKFGLCSHTWHLQALDLVLLGSGTGPSPPLAGLDTGWPIPYALSQARSLHIPGGLGCHLVAKSEN